MLIIDSEDELPSAEYLRDPPYDLGGEKDAIRAGSQAAYPGISSATRLDDRRHSTPTTVDGVDFPMAQVTGSYGEFKWSDFEAIA